MASYFSPCRIWIMLMVTEPTGNKRPLQVSNSFKLCFGSLPAATISQHFLLKARTSVHYVITQPYWFPVRKQIENLLYFDFKKTCENQKGRNLSFVHTCHCFKYTFLIDKKILIILIFSCWGSKQKHRLGSQTMRNLYFYYHPLFKQHVNAQTKSPWLPCAKLLTAICKGVPKRTWAWQEIRLQDEITNKNFPGRY